MSDGTLDFYDDVVVVRPESEDHIVIGVWDTLGVHSSAAITDSQRRDLIEELDATPNADLRDVIRSWREEITASNTGGEEAMRNHTLLDCADELERLIE